MDTVFLVLRVAVALGVVLAVIWYAQRRVGRSRARTRGASVVQVVARQSISPKASIAVVDADGRRLVLGVTEHGVTVLHDRAADPVEEPETVPAPAPARAEVPAAPLPHTAAAFGAALAAASAAPLHTQISPATHGSRRGTILSAETWKRSLAGVKEGLGL